MRVGVVWFAWLAACGGTEISVGGEQDGAFADARARKDATLAEVGFGDEPIAEAGIGPEVITGCVDPPGVVTLASGQSNPSPIAVDGTYVYWGDNRVSGATVMRVPKSGGPATTLVSGQSGANSVAVDAASVYWATSKHVMKAGLDGSGSTTLATTPYGTNGPNTMAIDDTNVYWADGHSLNQVPKAGGATSVLTTLGAGASGIAAHGSYVYWTDGGFGRVMRVRVGGGPVLAVTRHKETAPTAIVVDDTKIYWSDLDTGDVLNIALGGGGTVTLASRQATDTLALDSTALYWTSSSYGQIDPRHVVKLPLTGGSPVVLATLCCPVSYCDRLVVVDDTSVYWTTNPGDGVPGSVQRLTAK